MVWRSTGRRLFESSNLPGLDLAIRVDFRMVMDNPNVLQVVNFDPSQVPTPYGLPAAHESLGSVAAPLFAGFSLTLAALVLNFQTIKSDGRTSPSLHSFWPP